MSLSRDDFNKVDALVELAIEGAISPEQSRQLNEWIVNDPLIRRHYCEYIQLTVNMERLGLNSPATNSLDDDIRFDQELLKQLAYEEKTAPGIEVPYEKPRPELIRNVVYPPRERRRLSKFSIFTLINVAAVVLFFVVLRFAPLRGGVEVASLTDSIDAKWADVTSPMSEGTRLVTGKEQLLLREGYAELLFDTNARVVIEAPAEFQILAEDRIGLNYGKIYSVVPEEAIGFSVYTHNSKIIDMGTEFGVEVDPRGNTQLHVIKGKTMLIADDVSGKASLEVNHGEAKKISATTSDIIDISCESDLFARDIDSETAFVWKGRDIINLADIVGGGNGLGSGTVDMGIHPVLGKPLKAVVNDKGPASNQYHSVRINPYIDGVFIPNGRVQQVVSSKGHIFQECPVSSGDWYIGFDNVMRPGPSGSEYVPCIMQHANMGITFDLQAIRSLLLPDINIIRFQSKVEIGSEMDRPCNADFWVLVDGELRYKKTQIKEKKKYFNVDIDLSGKDRFLTLVTTDGQDPEGRVIDGLIVSTIDSDWCRFVEPVLVLE